MTQEETTHEKTWVKCLTLESYYFFTLTLECYFPPPSFTMDSTTVDRRKPVARAPTQSPSPLCSPGYGSAKLPIAGGLIFFSLRAPLNSLQT